MPIKRVHIESNQTNPNRIKTAVPPFSFLRKGHLWTQRLHGLSTGSDLYGYVPKSPEIRRHWYCEAHRRGDENDGNVAALADCFQVDTPGLRYKSVNFGAKRDPDPPSWQHRIDCEDRLGDEDVAIGLTDYS